MPTTNARRYAQALVNTLKSDRDLEHVSDELSRIRSVMGRLPALRRILGNPRLSPERRSSLLAGALGGAEPHPATSGLISILAEQRRMKILSDVASWFVRLKDKRTGATPAEIITVAPVPERDRPSWSEALGRMAGTPVRVEFRTDPTLIGGAMARVGSVLYDGSVRGSLERIRGQLLGEG